MINFFFLLLLFLSCTKKPLLPDSFPYDLENPSQIIILPKVLQEVSGIILEGRNLVCIEDESGKIYYYNLNSKTIVRVSPFNGPGDYEDIAKAGASYFVLCSDGTLFKISVGEKETINTPLGKKNNAEGLCYDSSHTRLLIALKGNPLKGQGHKKEVWGFNLASEKLSHKPIFSIELSQFKPYLGKKASRLKFKPSGISVHPLTGEIYIISATASLLVKTDFEGNILGLAWLNKDLFKQPEGICFDTSGTMYISNEGKKGNPTVLKFKLNEHE